ncbi:unnamed protein product [Closterium sp. NIES-53]
MAAQELRWLTYLLTDLGEPPRSPPVLYVDNKAMLALCREQRLEHRTKHIALRYFLALNIATARELQLALSRCLAEIDARLVDGTPLATREKLERAKVRCWGNFGLKQEMLATTLDGHDILLGRDWLRRYNPRIDWTTGSCTVRSNANWVELPRWQSPESSTVYVNAITMKRAVAAGADVYTVDIAMVEEAEQPSDFQKLLAAVPPELQELLPVREKFIRPSSSPFAAPILFTPKKDGGFRMCIEYRALNTVTVKSRYPIPRADKLIDQLRTARVFSKIDLRGGYHQIQVEPSDCAKTTFRTRYGSFEYTVMPFRLTKAPATFQMTMNEAFRPLLDKCVIIYLDNILVYSRDKQQHLADLEAVFIVLDKHRLLAKGSKCEFFQDRLEFLGHVISEAGVEIDPKKLDTVKAWHPPTELQSFLGFVNYVRRFVLDMAHLTAPLTDLLRKGVAFTWGEKEHAAFSTLKNLLCSPPVLRIADPHRPFEVVTDASDIAIGAVLLQDFGNGLQPIAYESRKLHPPEKNYVIHDREMLAIVHAFKVWRCYLTGADMTVRTDHESLQYLRAQPHLNPRQICWLDYLESNFHYTVSYKKGASNIADALTWPTAQLHAILLAQTSPLQTCLFTHGYQTDPLFTGGNFSTVCSSKRSLLLQIRHRSNLGTGLHASTGVAVTRGTRRSHLRTFRSRKNTAAAAVVLLLAQNADRRAATRGIVSHLPTHEIIAKVAGRAVAADTTPRACLAAGDDGLRHGVTGRNKWERRDPGRRRSADENDTFHCQNPSH